MSVWSAQLSSKPIAIVKMENRTKYLYLALSVLLGFIFWILILEIGLKHSSHNSEESNDKSKSHSDLELRARLDLLDTKYQHVLSILEGYEKHQAMITRREDKLESDMSAHAAKFEKQRESNHKLEIRVLTLENKVGPILTKLEDFEQLVSEKYEKFSVAMEVKHTAVQDIIKKMELKLINLPNFEEELEKIGAQMSIFESYVVSVNSRLNEHENRSSVPLENYNEWKSSVEARLDKKHQSIEKLKSDLSHATANFSSNSQQADNRFSKLETKLASSLTKLGEYEGNLSASIQQFASWKLTVATDVRLSDKELNAVWSDRGYFDESSYVITEVSNFNSDAYPDMVGRRRIQKLVNGSWVNI